MTRKFLAVGAFALFAIVAFGQSSSTVFEVADVHPAPRSTTPFMRTFVRAGRYEVRNATLVDLIHTAYGVDSDKIVGGPSWLEYDRFDIIAKLPPNTSAETQKTMLKALVADRFKLVVHDETKSIPGYVLTAGKGKPKLKEADPSGKAGCQTQLDRPTGAPTGGIFVPLMNVSCRNMTMGAFAAELRRLAGSAIANNVVDSTALKGSWDFDFKWTAINIFAAGAESERITIFDAVDKQLGLKLDEQKIPTPVLVVDQAVEKPTDNPQDLAAKLPPPPPSEFEVADVKPRVPGSIPQGARIGVLPGGRVNLPGIPLRLVINLAWNLNSSEDVVGAPKWIDSASFDIIAKMPEELAPTNGGGALQDLGPMLQALMIDRFKMKAHFEDRPVNAYTLVSAKPKMKKADPGARTVCKTGNANNVVTSGVLRIPERVVTCQNVTMAQFADQLQIIAGPYVHYPVVNATGLEGAWDFSFTYSPIPPNQLAGQRGAPPGATPGADAVAADPGGGTSLFDAVEKQLGLKLESQKRPYPVFVIDHIEEKPTEN